MKLIFIYGLPASGKLTVARELASMTGYKLFHNHLVVDTLLSVFEFGSPEFIRLREQIWLSVFTEAAHLQIPALIFTFAPEATVRPSFIPELLASMQSSGSEVFFVQLTCPLPELKQRLNAPSRSQHNKLTSVDLFEELHAAGRLDDSAMPAPDLSIDTSKYTPQEAATEIMNGLNSAPLPLSAEPTHSTHRGVA